MWISNEKWPPVWLHILQVQNTCVVLFGNILCCCAYSTKAPVVNFLHLANLQKSTRLQIGKSMLFVSVSERKRRKLWRSLWGKGPFTLGDNGAEMLCRRITFLSSSVNSCSNHATHFLLSEMGVVPIPNSRKFHIVVVKCERSPTIKDTLHMRRRLSGDPLNCDWCCYILWDILVLLCWRFDFGKIKSLVVQIWFNFQKNTKQWKVPLSVIGKL